MDYILVRKASVKRKISERRVQKLCEEEHIDDVLRFGRSWMIPKDTQKPYDKRRREALQTAKC